MTEPEEFMLPLLEDIETTSLKLYQEFPRLIDKEIEVVYEKLANHFKGLSSGKILEEPSHPIERCASLIDEILNTIDEREAEKLDEEIVDDPDFTVGGQRILSLHHFYAIAFRRLQKSVRFWRKENGKRGYIAFVSRFLALD